MPYLLMKIIFIMDIVYGFVVIELLRFSAKFFFLLLFYKLFFEFMVL